MNIRLAVIDDEVLVRKGVISSVDWKHYDIDIVGEATDGVSGLELIRRTKPHIVLTDIKMPHMDGLELTRIIRREFPETKIMMLSVLEDFQTLREALRLGVVDYVQKLLMKPEDLLQTVLQIKQSFAAPAHPEREETRRRTDGLRDDERRPDVVGWLKGKDSQALEQRLGGASSYIVGKLYAKQATPFKSDADAAAPQWEEVERWLRQSNDAVLRGTMLGAENERTCWLVAVGSETALSADSLRCALQPLIERCLSINMTLSVGLSGSFRGAANRMDAARQAEQAEQQRFINGFGQVGVFEEQTACASADALPPFLHHAALIDYFALLRLEGEEQAGRAFERLFPPQLDASMSPVVVREGIYYWISQLMSHLQEREGTLEGTLSSYSPFAQAADIETYAELKDWCRRLHQVIREMLHSRHRAEIHRAIEYTNSHYMNPIRVKEVADAVNLSENYFSYLFSKETGKPYVQFLQETRIEKAKQLLREPQSHWLDVMDKVGFESAKHFAKIFKKHTGMTPVQYARENGAIFEEKKT